MTGWPKSGFVTEGGGWNIVYNVGVALVNFYVNGGLQCSGTGNTCNWNVPAKPGAAYSLQAIAYDAAGNAGSSSMITVTSQ